MIKIYAVMDERWNYDEDASMCLGASEDKKEAEAIQRANPGSVIVEGEKP